jgi:hypothetical protein
MKFVTRVVFYLSLNCGLYFSSYATVYYVDPVNGKDINNGLSVESAFISISKAISTFKAGDTTYLRGGTYSLTTTINISSSMEGASEKQYNLFAFPGDARPVLDFSSMAVDGSNRGIYLKGDYWYIKGIDIKGAGDNGMNITGWYNKIEDCALYENRDTGLQLSSGASYNRIINCDSYYNSDPGQGNADGFAPKLNVGTENYFYGCRSWQNSDDGWDGYMRVDAGSDTCTTILENCWCFKNGYLKDSSASQGNGNGYKMGGSDQKNLRHNFILKNCIAFDNRVKGFDQNNNKGSMTLLNCTSFRNGTNYGMNSALDSGNIMIIKNCISLGSSALILSGADQENNSWIAPLSVSDTDFVDLDPTAAYGKRKADGSLPDLVFLHLAEGSSLIDAGADVGLPFNGTAPDLGAFESEFVSLVGKYRIQPETFMLYQNFPNPFNPSTMISYQLPVNSKITLKVFNSLGQEVQTLGNEYQIAGLHTTQFTVNSSLPSGIYFYKLAADNFVLTNKMVLLK